MFAARNGGITSMTEGGCSRATNVPRGRFVMEDLRVARPRWLIHATSLQPGPGEQTVHHQRLPQTCFLSFLDRVSRTEHGRSACHLGPILVAALSRNVAAWGSPAGSPEKQKCENQREADRAACCEKNARRGFRSLTRSPC